MTERSIYRDIAERTNGDIYIGVVGPVRTGKSTFIKKFMDTIVIPNIDEENLRTRTNDELPQSAGGRTIMTTEPKFIPEEAMEISLPDNAHLKVRMIDCVGYVVDESMGYMEDDRPRMVKTPWSEDEIPFNEAAEIGTKKVINDHSTIGLVITTDGSISDISRDSYVEAEERVVNELKSIDKPFVVLLNCVDPQSRECSRLSNELSLKYQVPVMPVNCLTIDENEIKRVMAQVLFEFPIREINIDMPRWVVNLSKDHWLKSDIFSKINECARGVEKLRQVQDTCNGIGQDDFVSASEIKELDLGKGIADIKLLIDSGCFYKVMSEKTGTQISDEEALMESISMLSAKQKEFDKIAAAYRDVEEKGYGIVMPTLEELTLDEPQIIKQSGKYGIRLKASAPSIHMMKVETEAEVTPIVGSEQQSQELVSYLLKEFEENPVKIWESNIFGKSVHELVNEGLHNKLYRMPEDARRKIGETIEKIINDGCNGLICIIL
ncbi:MAG: stage IV sporulation protein A [Ruminococcus sp.]|nr:stage IV sporulation protein A [Ruminococcus sp.]